MILGLSNRTVNFHFDRGHEVLRLRHPHPCGREGGRTEADCNLIVPVRSFASYPGLRQTPRETSRQAQQRATGGDLI
jgi:hypothetical protein